MGDSSVESEGDDDVKEYMFIEKEEPEFDETENVESLVNAALLQSAEWVEGTSSISDEQVHGEAQVLNPRSLLDQHVLSLPTEENGKPTSGATSTVTSNVTVENMKSLVSNTSSVQIHPRVTQTNTVTTHANSMRSGQFPLPSFSQMNTLQNVRNVHNIVANVMQRTGTSQIEASNRSFLQTSSLSPYNLKELNCSRMGITPETSQGLLQSVPATSLLTQRARFGIPQHNFHTLSKVLPQNIYQTVRVPQLTHVRPVTTARVPQLTHVPPVTTARVPQLTHVPPVTRVQHTTLQAAQLNLMKNLGIPLQRHRLPTPIRNMSLLNAFQNGKNHFIHALQSQMTRTSQVQMQRFVPVSSVSQNVKQTRSVGNTQTKIQGSGISRSHESSQMSPSVRSCLQFNVPQFCSPQLVTNALQSTVPLRPSVLLHPPVSSHQAITPQSRAPDLNLRLQQNLTSNIQRLSVPRIVTSGPRIGVTPLTTNVQRMNVPLVAASVPPLTAAGVTPLTTNVQRMNVPLVAASVPRINATHVTGSVCRGVVTLNTSQMSRSMNRPLIPPNVTKVGMPRFKIPGMSLPSLSTTVPPMAVPQTSTKSTQLRLSSRATNLGLQSQVRMSSANPPELSPQSLEQIWTRIIQHSQLKPIQGTTSTPATCAATSQTSMVKTPLQPWQSTSMNCDSNVLEGTQQRDRQEIPKTTGASMSSAVSGMQQQQETVGNSSQHLAGVLQHTENSELETFDSTIHKKLKEKIKTATAKKHLKHQLAFRKLWKKFEKYNFKYLNSAYKKKLIEARKRRHLLLMKNRTILPLKNVLP